MTEQMEAINYQWFKTHLLEVLLPRWLASSVTKEGLFLPALDRQWRRKGPQSGTPVSQSRLIFNFASGFHLTGDRLYLDAAAGGAAFLRDHFHDPNNGGYFWRCGPDGAVLDDHKNAYGNAFVLFGLAHAFGATHDQRCLDAAMEQWRAMRTLFTDKHGGLIPSLTVDMRPNTSARSQNPVMHYFEALLALHNVANDREVLTDAQRIAEFVAVSLVRPETGLLPEVYDDEWQPLSADQDGRIDIGHQFEWAWLFSQGIRQGLDPAYFVVAQRMMKSAMQIGFDDEIGGVFSPATPDGVARRECKGWWEQCETVRAMMRYQNCHNAIELHAPLARTIRYMQNSLQDNEYGGWYGRVNADGTVPNTDKGSEWKVDYHIVGMCNEAIAYV